MENTHNISQRILLPRYFRVVGLGSVLIAFAVMLLYKLSSTELLLENTEVLKELTMNLIILGLFFIAWSKDKVEDELTLLVRLRAVAWAFGFSVLNVIFNPIVSLLIGSKAEMISGQQAMLTMILAFLIMYYIQKKSR
jgi:membrane protease YdiL (CAAX protease family)